MPKPKSKGLTFEAWMPRLMKPSGRVSLVTCSTSGGYAMLFETAEAAQAVVDRGERDGGVLVGTVQRVRVTIEYIDGEEATRG